MIPPLNYPKHLAVLVLGALLGACSVAPHSVDPVPVPPTRTLAEAGDKLDEAVKLRAAVEATYARAEQLCYAKFFVTDCLDDAKEQRRVALVRLRAIEIEAELFQRRARLADREKAVATAEHAAQAEEARRMAEPRQASPEAQRQMQRDAQPPKQRGAERAAANAARLKQRDAQQAADRPKRAEKAAATAKRRAESEQRQREIAEKLQRKQAQDKQAQDKQAQDKPTQ